MTAITTTLISLVLSMSAFAANSDNIDSPAQREAAAIVQQLRDFPPALPVGRRMDGKIDPLEQRREELYERLRRLDNDAQRFDHRFVFAHRLSTV